MIPTLPPLHSIPDHAPIVLQRLGVTVRLMASAADTNGTFTLLDYSAPPGFAGPHQHYHRKLIETFYVLEGRLTMLADGQTTVLNRGELLAVPPGVRHAFSSTHPEPVRFLVLFTPGGMENYFRDLDQLVKNAPSWPLPDLSPIIALAERYDTYS